MPPRISRQSAPSAAAGPSKKRKVAKSQKRALNAFTAAQHVVNDDSKFRRHRLGEVEAEPAQKRRRVDAGGEDDEEGAGDEDRRGGVDDEDRGNDSSGNEWRMGGPIGEDSDSSLDSDEAFGSSDEEKFEGFTFRGSSSNKKAPRKEKRKPASGDDEDMDLEESDGEEEEDEDDFGEDGVDLATMLDDPGSDSESADDADTEEDEDSEAETSASDAESDDAHAAKISKLQDLVASLEQKPASRRTDAGPDAHETRQPSDFGVTAAQKLQLADLIPTITDPSLRKSLQTLAAPDKPSKTRGIPGKLSAPLPKRAQDKNDRVAAADKAKAELDKWQDTVIRNRRAEFLQFPLVDPSLGPAAGTDTLTSVADDKPRTELEGAIAAIMEESGLADAKKGAEEEGIAAGEELEMKEVPVEEVMARRAALRRARDLLFREEIKAKRIKKIKSKSYRRVHRRERERAAEKERALYGEEQGEEELAKMERRRAEERMSAKHRESKWAKGMKKAGRTVWDTDAREGVVEMARRNEELRRRIEGRDVAVSEEGSDDSSDNEEEDDIEGEGSDFEREKLIRKVDRLTEDGEAPEQGIGGMAFMKRAEAARKRRNDEAIADLRRTLAGEDAEDAEAADQESSLGRRIFGPKPTAVTASKPKKDVLEEPEDSAAEDDDDDEGAEIITETAQPVQLKSSGRARSGLSGHAGQKATAKDGKANVNDKAVRREDSDDGEWLKGDRSNKDRSNKDSDDDEWIKRDRRNKKASKARDAEFDPSKVKLAAPASAPVKKTKATAPRSKAQEASAPDTSGWTVVVPAAKKPALADSSSSSSSASDSDSDLVSAKTAKAALRERAFAGDDVELAFAADKTAQASDEDFQTTSTHLPGWGSWTGGALPKAVRRANARARHDPLFKTRSAVGTRAADRRDAKLENVIISESRGRKGRKYLAGQIPHGFENKGQYEAALRVPIGPEWTTKETFQRGTRPRVVVKQGIVEALERPLV